MKKKKKNWKKTKHRKGQRRFRPDGAIVRGGRVTSEYCTASLLHRRFLSPALTSVHNQE